MPRKIIVIDKDKNKKYLEYLKRIQEEYKPETINEFGNMDLALKYDEIVQKKNNGIFDAELDYNNAISTADEQYTKTTTAESERLKKAAEDKYNFKKANIYSRDNYLKGEENVLSCGFTKEDIDALESVRNHKRTFHKTRSQEFIDLRTSIERFNALYDSNYAWGRTTDDEGLEKKAQKMIDSLNDICKNVKRYVERKNAFRLFASGRKKRALKLKEIAEQKILELSKFIEDVKTDRDTVVTNRNKLFNDGMQEFDAAAKKTSEDSKAKAKVKYEETLKNVENEDKKQTAELQKEIDKYVADERAKLPEKEKKAVNKFNLDVIAYDLAEHLFPDNLNPFPDYKDGFAAYERINNANDKKKTAGYADINILKSGSGYKNIPITYSPEALMALANLRFLDSLLGINRAQNDYIVEFDTRKDAAGEDFLLVTNIKARRISDKCNSFKKETSTNKVTFDAEAMITKDAMVNLLHLDVDTMVGLLPSGVAQNMKDEIDFVKQRITEANEIFEYNSERKFDEKDLQTFNVVDEKRLVENIAQDGIFFNIGSNINYYDSYLLLNINKNIISKTEEKVDLSADVKNMLFKKSTLLLADTALYGPELSEIMKNPGNDTELQKIVEIIGEAPSWNPNELNSYGYVYITENGTTDVEPKKDFLKVRELDNRYEKKAVELYKKIGDYIAKHEEELKNDDKSPAAILKAWRTKAYLEDSPRVPDEEISLDLTAETTDPATEDVRRNGDADYLFTAKLALYEKSNFFTSSSTETEEKLSAEKINYVLKDVRDEPLFVKMPSADDIKQGKVGDCYFISAITSMVKDDPQKIKDMIHDNGNGTVTCRFTKNGVPFNVKISKKLACAEVGKGKNGDPLYVSAVSQERAPLWFHMLSKAYMLSELAPFDYDSLYRLEDIRKCYNVTDKVSDQELMRRVIGEWKPDLSKEKLKNMSDDEIKKLFIKFLGRGFIGFTGGHASDVLRNMGQNKNVRYYVNEGVNSAYIIGALRYIKQGNLSGYLKLTGKNDDTVSSKNLKIISAAGKEASMELMSTHSCYSKDRNGKPYVAVRPVSLDEMLDVLKNSVERVIKKNPGKYKEDEVTRVINSFCSDIETHQMNEPEKKYAAIITKPGKYNKRALNIFETLKKHRDMKSGLSCAFMNKLDFIGKPDLSEKRKAALAEGIHTNHAYPLMDCYEKNGMKMIVLRNPWGDGSSRRETAEFLSGENRIVKYGKASDELDDYNRDNGVFEMELNDFMQKIKVIDANEDLIVKDNISQNVAAKAVAAAANNGLIQTKTMNQDEIIAQAAKLPSVQQYTENVLRCSELQDKKAFTGALTKTEEKELKALNKKLKKDLDFSGTEKKTGTTIKNATENPVPGRM